MLQTMTFPKEQSNHDAAMTFLQSLYNEAEEILRNRTKHFTIFLMFTFLPFFFQ